MSALKTMNNFNELKNKKKWWTLEFQQLNVHASEIIHMY